MSAKALLRPEGRAHFTCGGEPEEDECPLRHVNGLRGQSLWNLRSGGNLCALREETPAAAGSKRPAEAGNPCRLPIEQAAGSFQFSARRLDPPALHEAGGGGAEGLTAVPCGLRDVGGIGLRFLSSRLPTER